MNYRLTYVLGLASFLSVVSCDDEADPPPAACGQGRVCDCTPGDPNCSPCQDGYRPALVGSECVPTCSAPIIACGDHGTCEETGQGAVCQCQPGYTGASCSACASGLAQNDAGLCVAELSAPALLTLSNVDEEVFVGALVPPAWDFLPMVPVPNTVSDVAYDAAAEVAYMLDGGRLFSVDLATGATVGLTAEDADLGSALCLDAAGRRAFTASAEAVNEIDLEAFGVTELGAFGASALEYDAERGLVIGVDAAGATFELTGSGPVVVGQAPELDSLAMAFDSVEGRAYFVGTEAEDDEARLLRYCSSTLTRFGAVPAWQTQVVSEVATGTEPYVLDYQGADSALIAVDLAETGISSIQVTAAHPDAALCIVAEGSTTTELDIEVTADARLSYIVVVAPTRSVALDLSARSADSSYSVVVYTAEGLTTTGSSAGVTEYDAEAWGGLALTTLADFATRPAATLVLMDWATQATLPLDLAHQPAGAALAWVGAAP
jgi:EGF-like domain